MNLLGFNKAYISDHIKKVLVNYNPRGLRYSVEKRNKELYRTTNHRNPLNAGVLVVIIVYLPIALYICATI